MKLNWINSGNMPANVRSVPPNRSLHVNSSRYDGNSVAFHVLKPPVPIAFNILGVCPS